MNRSERIVDYERMFDPPDFHEEDGCAECHMEHRELNIFERNCLRCQDERCTVCFGKGIIGTGCEQVDCQMCKGAGRINL